jgi:hypothetical protein
VWDGKSGKEGGRVKLRGKAFTGWSIFSSLLRDMRHCSRETSVAEGSFFLNE